jgi:lincosamide nucleotidyltransferase A/C/D/E
MGDMPMDRTANTQLQTIGWLHSHFAEHGIDYWLFGGWAVDFHAGQVTRRHEDVDLAVWQADLPRIRADLEANGWTHAPEEGEDGYTGYERDGLRLELAFLTSDEAGTYTPLVQGRGEWPSGSFVGHEAELGGVRARVVGLDSLIEDKGGPREDATVLAKDRADLAVLTGLRTDD